MKMRDLNLVNEELISKLDKLAVLVDKIFANEDFVDRMRHEKNMHANPLQRIKEQKDPLKVAPHWFELPDDVRSNTKEGQYDPCGRAYLNYMQNLMYINNKSYTACGYPNKETFFSGQQFYNDPKTLAELGVPEFKDAIYDISAGFLGGQAMALCGFYTPDTYIPWHHNGNASGFNILLHYNKVGEGSFFTYHEGEIIEYKDKPGWVARGGKFYDTLQFDSNAGKVILDYNKERDLERKARTTHEKATPENASWHAAHAVTNRFTLSTIVNEEFLWEDLMDEIEGH